MRNFLSRFVFFYSDEESVACLKWKTSKASSPQPDTITQYNNFKTLSWTCCVQLCNIYPPQIPAWSDVDLFSTWLGGLKEGNLSMHLHLCRWRRDLASCNSFQVLSQHLLVLWKRWDCSFFLRICNVRQLWTVNPPSLPPRLEGSNSPRAWRSCPRGVESAKRRGRKINKKITVMSSKNNGTCVDVLWVSTFI